MTLIDREAAEYIVGGVVGIAVAAVAVVLGLYMVSIIGWLAAEALNLVGLPFWGLR